jgi:hypothetical protein
MSVAGVCIIPVCWAIVAAMFAGLLAVLVLASRTRFPAPAAGQHPTDLVVVRDGQVSCCQAGTETAGQVRVAGRSLSAVTQLLQVDHG